MAPRPPPQQAFSVQYDEQSPVQFAVQDSVPWPAILVPVVPARLPAGMGAPEGEEGGKKEEENKGNGGNDESKSESGLTLTVGVLLWEKRQDQVTGEVVWVHSVTKQRLTRDPYV